jgi:hypothetical protein
MKTARIAVIRKHAGCPLFLMLLTTGCVRYADFTLPTPESAGPRSPFTWTASIDSILEKVGRCKAVLETVH